MSVIPNTLIESWLGSINGLCWCVMLQITMVLLYIFSSLRFRNFCMPPLHVHVARQTVQSTGTLPVYINFAITVSKWGSKTNMIGSVCLGALPENDFCLYCKQVLPIWVMAVLIRMMFIVNRECSYVCVPLLYTPPLRKIIKLTCEVVYERWY